MANGGGVEARCYKRPITNVMEGVCVPNGGRLAARTNTNIYNQLDIYFGDDILF
jgi:hypothetical protein